MIEDLDRQLAALVKRSRRLLWFIISVIGFVLLAAMGVVAVLFVTSIQQRHEIGQLITQSAREQQQLTTVTQLLHAGNCTFDRDLASAPVSINPATGKPSTLGVSIVADAHNAYVDIHCDGSLPPNPSLQHWAAIFHIPLRS